jgi:hypothetical protein
MVSMRDTEDTRQSWVRYTSTMVDIAQVILELSGPFRFERAAWIGAVFGRSMLFLHVPSSVRLSTESFRTLEIFTHCPRFSFGLTSVGLRHGMGANG